MVPLPSSPQAPCFPQCVEWILQNQQSNGSWGLSQMDSSVNKYVLSSTLACVLALKKWNVGSEHIRRGVHFIGRNFCIVMDDEQIAAPVGFNITFSGMLSLAIGMDLEFPVRKTDADGILHRRELELTRLAGDKSDGREPYMAYVAEGLGNLLDCNEVMKFQRKNGSLFNSLSTTAAALIHSYDDKALQYLNLLVSKYGSSVPTIYPANIYCQLSMVDSLEKIGVSRHFSSEIKSILDVTYREMRKSCWRADGLSHVAEASTFQNSLQGYVNDTKSILELYKASKKSGGLIGSRERQSLERCLHEIYDLENELILYLFEVEYALEFPFYATLERLYHKSNITHFDARDSQMLKREYLPCGVKQDLALAVEDFTFCQSIYQDELQHLDSWAKENRLDQLQYSWHKLTYCYFSAAATIFPPDLSDARISWAKNGVLITIVNDFFDYAGSKKELENLIAAVEKWDEHYSDEFYSDEVRILFSAIYTTVNQLGARASALQNRDVTEHLIETWLHVLRSMMKETEWRMSQYVPTMEEYMKNAVVSAGLEPIVLSTLYFIGQRFLWCSVQDQEYNELLRLVRTICHLLNDSQNLEVFGSLGQTIDLAQLCKNMILMLLYIHVPLHVNSSICIYIHIKD